MKNGFYSLHMHMLGGAATAAFSFCTTAAFSAADPVLVDRRLHVQQRHLEAYAAEAFIFAPLRVARRIQLGVGRLFLVQDRGRTTSSWPGSSVHAMSGP
jgi:hypothetical protein